MDIEQKLKRFAINEQICKQCLSNRDKPCIFQHNNDEHLCFTVIENYIRRLEK